MPLKLANGLTLEQYDQDSFGFLRLEVEKKRIVGAYFSAPFQLSGAPAVKPVERFALDLVKHTVQTLS